MSKVVIVRTGKGAPYGYFIAKEINLRGFRCKVLGINEVVDFLTDNNWAPSETVIHARTANPDNVFKTFKGLEDKGYRVINKADTVRKTSDKFVASQLALEKGLSSPRVWRVDRVGGEELIREKMVELGKIVVKPITSREQGKYSFLFEKNKLGEIKAKLALMPPRSLFIQEFVDYERLYRVVVVGYKALPKAVFYDEPRNDWKASVCLNPNLFYEKNPDEKLLRLAEGVARKFGAEICFIDFFKTKKGEWILNEINTACNLMIHERKSGFNISAKIAEYLISQLKTL